jgi:formamidopyrimidine-DNA glycosylase
MPELPEVETVVRTLRPMMVGQRIRDVELFWPKTIVDFKRFKAAVVNQRVEAVQRRGKYILIELEQGTIVVHLRMEGRFYERQGTALHKHTHALLHLEDRSLEYNDSRKFGRIHYSNHARDELNQKLGLEPFDPALTAGYLKQKAVKRRIALKSFLLDQSIIAGIGNIYADEICFAMKISPRKSVTRLRLKDFQACVEHTQAVLAQAIELGGSSVRSYTSSLGISGRFQLQIKVYGRAHQPCITCQTPLKGVRIGQRSSVYCPSCQR